ncbi:hypothetical protein QAD02_021767 [Eretmocerus hayati]|uniref:Uncharacterized protein n=1 Tax=Eretmocerus hayati TaxID=131215 RepID=A0ACC2PQU5_9HYME|nr:hypothetical protein QAD02_021767 [Eretmocerus hayati]
MERKFDTKFEEEKKERGEANFWFKELVEQMKKDDELREREWTARWGEKEREDKKRDEKQVELEERLKRIETLIEEKGEGIHMEVESNERAKEREICKEKEITELKRRIKEGERRDKGKNIIVSGLKLDDEGLKENLGNWIDENLNIEVTITKAWKVKGRDGKEIIGAELIRKGIAYKGKYVETWMKERTGKDYNQWALEGLNRKGSYAHDAWVVKTFTKEVEEKLLETMKERGEKEFTVEKFISAEERWKMKRHCMSVPLFMYRGYTTTAQTSVAQALGLWEVINENK